MTVTSARSKLLALLLLASASAGCSPSLRTNPLAFGDNVGVYTNGNLRLVTERSRLQPDSGRVLPTVCTEPTPDHAIAFDQSGALAANVIGQGAGALTFNSTEAATQLPGRNAGVLALRDGLYAACQSYVNGVIGHDAYALILSQYSDLLVELVHSEEAKDFSAATVTPSATGQANPTPIPGASGAADPLGLAVRPAVLSETALSRGTGGAMLAIAAAAPPAVAATPQGGAAPTPTPSSAAAEEEKTKEAVHAAILVACISEHDPTRIGGESGQPKNPLLSERYCRRFLSRSLSAQASQTASLGARKLPH